MLPHGRSVGASFVTSIFKALLSSVLFNFCQLYVNELYGKLEEFRSRFTFMMYFQILLFNGLFHRMIDLY